MQKMLKAEPKKSLNIAEIKSIMLFSVIHFRGWKLCGKK